jgi:glycosyltransferase involved in cell wall biosynthesis
MKKKVLHLITGLEHGGGAEASLVKTLPFLEKTNVAVCAMTGRGEDGKALERADVEVFYLDMKGKFDVRGVWRYYQVLRAYQPDVQVNYLIHADIFGRIFGKLFRVPKIISYIRNHHVGGLYERLDRATFPLADFVLTNSEANLRYYHKNYKLSAKKSACIPNAVELPDISKNNRENVGLFKKDENIPDALLVITCVARLHPQKSHETLFHALRRLKDGGTQVQALLVGEGQELPTVNSSRQPRTDFFSIRVIRRTWQRNSAHLWLILNSAPGLARKHGKQCRRNTISKLFENSWMIFSMNSLYE